MLGHSVKRDRMQDPPGPRSLPLACSAEDRSNGEREQERAREQEREREMNREREKERKKGEGRERDVKFCFILYGNRQASSERTLSAPPRPPRAHHGRRSFLCFSSSACCSFNMTAMCTMCASFTPCCSLSLSLSRSLLCSFSLSISLSLNFSCSAAAHSLQQQFQR